MKSKKAKKKGVQRWRRLLWNVKKEKKVKGWSKAKQLFLEEDTEEVKKWRGMSQEEMDQCWKRLAEKMEEEALDKYKVDDIKRGA